MRTAHVIVASVLTALVATLAVRAQNVLPPDETRTLGAAVPRVWLIDEHGDTLRVGDLAGSPLIVSPVFTTCPHICPAITASLVSALDGVGGVGETFNVLTVSFDPADTADELRAYREKTAMPPQWVLSSGHPDQVGPFLEALDFQYVTLPGGGFGHANVVAFLTPELTVSGYLHGLMYTTDEVKAALRVAAGRRPLVESARPWLIGLAFLALLVTALVIVATARRSSSPPQSDAA
jgi:protein SCO1/2